MDCSEENDDEDESRELIFARVILFLQVVRVEKLNYNLWLCESGMLGVLK